MIERIEGMPAGTIGFRASGKLNRADYRDVLEPGSVPLPRRARSGWSS